MLPGIIKVQMYLFPCRNGLICKPTKYLNFKSVS